MAEIKKEEDFVIECSSQNDINSLSIIKMEESTIDIGSPSREKGGRNNSEAEIINTRDNGDLKSFLTSKTVESVTCKRESKINLKDDNTCIDNTSGNKVSLAKVKPMDVEEECAFLICSNSVDNDNNNSANNMIKNECLVKEELADSSFSNCLIEDSRNGSLNFISSILPVRTFTVNSEEVEQASASRDEIFFANFDSGGAKKNYGNFRKHMQKNIHKSSKSFKSGCFACNYQAEGEVDLKVHLQGYQNEEGEYKCPKCTLTTMLKGNFRTNPGKKSYGCFACDYQAEEEADLQVHLQGHHHEEGKYKCPKCMFATTWKGNFKKHMQKNMHKNKGYGCFACDYQAEGEVNLKVHLQGHQNEEGKYECPKCMFTTTWKNSFKKHIIENMHKDMHNNRNTHSLLFFCTQCDFRANRKDDFKLHMIQHETEKN